MREGASAQQENSMNKVILASDSPRRKLLLENYGFDVTVVKPDFDESTILENDAALLVTALARAKNRCVSQTSSCYEFPVIAADTVVCLDNQILGKPSDRTQAYNMLSMLSGATHTVFTGVCISFEKRQTVFCEKTDVSFYKLSKTQIYRYIDSGSPFDKAGGYGIQDDMGIAFIESIKGELSNVIGLPMARTVSEIKKIQGDKNET